MSDIPSLKEELNRKTFETVERLVNDRAFCKATDAQYDYGIEILWGTVAGLVDKDFMDIAANMRLTSRDESFVTRAHLRNAKGDSVVLENGHKGVIRMTVYRAGSHVPTKRETIDLREESQATQQADLKFNELALKLEANGFYRI